MRVFRFKKILTRYLEKKRINKQCRLIMKSKLFDVQFYNETYPDVHDSSINPVEHFVRFGGMEGRNPSRDFHSQWYLDAYGTELDDGVNPLVDYLEVGVKAGRQVKQTKLVKYEGTSLQLGSAENINTENTDYEYISTSDDPYFNLAAPLLMSVPGWKVLTLSLDMSIKSAEAKLYLDTGMGFNETETVVLAITNTEIVQRIFFVSDGVLNLRFDPIDKIGGFTVNSIKLASLDPQDVDALMLSEVTLNKNYKTELLAREAVEQKSKDENVSYSHALQALYNECFDPSAGVGYEVWIDEVESTMLPTAEYVETTIKNMVLKPLISIVMPTYNVPEAYLKDAIDSVIRQSYTNWQLCIADDASPEPHVSNILQQYAKKDRRITYVIREENGHISAASNSALELAVGDYIALMDHDDTLSENALFEVVAAINTNSSVQIIYSDEDKIDEKGKRFDPHFKSDWNLDLLLSQNYLSHLGVYKAELIQKVGGFKIGVEGSQDYDLLLRCLLHIDNKDIHHIPKVLYHWRAIAGSTALDGAEKSYTTDAGIQALQSYFSSQNMLGVNVKKGMVANTYRVIYPIPEQAPLVSLLIPTRDGLEYLKPCIDSILNKTTYQNYEIIILDNGSEKTETLEYLKFIQKKDKRIKVLEYNAPFNYSAINNFGVEQAAGEVIGLINNDVEVISPDWLTEMVRHAIRPEIGCVGAKLYYDDNTIQHAGVILGIGGVAGHSHKNFHRSSFGYFSRLVLSQNLSSVTAACLLIRKETYEQVAGLDEENLHVAFNDVDFCLKVRSSGYRNLWTPYAELYHYESKSRGFEDTPEKQARFNKEIGFMKDKWNEALHYDPFYNENLTKVREDFSIK